jgi:DNA (cytosine-5)-methyltransferase 1
LRNGSITDETQTLQAAGLGTDRGGNPSAMPATFSGMAVRRLTPRECERLQGFPDDYTLITYHKILKSGKLSKRLYKAADGPRYKALGNSMAVPVMAWIGRRIEMVEGISTEFVRMKEAE